jgi:hypothetical protein
MSIMSLPRLVGDHDDPRILHSLWCREHVNYDPERSPEHGCCTMPFEVEFPVRAVGDDEASAKVELWFAASEVDASPAGVAYVSFGPSDHDACSVEAWKLVPVAYAMLAAEAQSRGETERAERFMAFARTAVSAHLAEVAA